MGAEYEKILPQRREDAEKNLSVLRRRRNTKNSAPLLVVVIVVVSHFLTYRLIQRLTALRATSLAGRATRPVRLMDTLYLALSVIGRKTALP